MKASEVLHFARRIIGESAGTLGNLVRESPLPRWLGWLLICALSVVVPVVVNLATSVVPFTVTWPVWFVLTFIALSKLVSAFPKIESVLFCLEPQSARGAFCRWMAITFVVHFLMVAIFGFEVGYDSDKQWREVLSGHLSDWHPFIHTYLVYLISRVWTNQLAVWFVQLVCLALLGGWLEVTLLRMNLKPVPRRIIFCLVVFSPVALCSFRSVYKDVAFALSVLGTVLAVINIGLSRGVWLKSWRAKVLTSVVVLFAGFFRHNGIFITIPLFIFFFALIGRKYIVHAVLTFVLMILVCGGYVGLRTQLVRAGLIYNPGDQRYVEAIGVPITIMGDLITHRDNGRFSKESIAFCEKLAPLVVWDMYYRGHGNSVKDHLNFEWLVRTVPPAEFARVVFKMSCEDPVNAFKAFVRITGIGWNPFPEQLLGRMKPYCSVVRSGDLKATCNLLSLPPIGWVFSAPGFAFCCLLVLGTLGMIRFGIGRVVPCVMLMAYNLGTCLLMYDDGRGDFRFFWAIVLTYPIAAVFSLVRTTEIHAPTSDSDNKARI